MKIVYEAIDGRIFDTREACEEHELSCPEYTVEKFIKHIVKGDLDTSVLNPYGTKILHDWEEDRYVLYDLKDEEAVKDFENYAKSIKEDQNPNMDKYKGKIVLVCVWCGDRDRCYLEGTEKEFKADFDKYVTDMFSIKETNKVGDKICIYNLPLFDANGNEYCATGGGGTITKIRGNCFIVEMFDGVTLAVPVDKYDLID